MQISRYYINDAMCRKLQCVIASYEIALSLFGILYKIGLFYIVIGPNFIPIRFLDQKLNWFYCIIICIENIMHCVYCF